MLLSSGYITGQFIDDKIKALIPNLQIAREHKSAFKNWV